METFGISDLSTGVFETLSLLRPFDIDIPKLRIGPPRDGGYVLADLGGTSDLMSFGISNDVRFEKVLADRGSQCFMYDHTIEALPETHERFKFHKVGVSGSLDEGVDVKSIATHMKPLNNPTGMILKIDVEGAEWDVFSTMEAHDLNKFDQIVGEFHWFLRLNEPDFRQKVRSALENLTRHFTLFHIHANNCRPLGFVDGLPVADVLEMSFVRTELTKRSPSVRIFPEACDKANNFAIGDHPLLFYPFLPVHDFENIGRTVARISDERYSY